MLDDLINLTFGLLAVSREKAEELINYLTEKGEMQREEARKLVNRLMEKGSSEGERYFNRAKEAIGERLITKEDFARLESKIDHLLSQLHKE